VVMTDDTVAGPANNETELAWSTRQLDVQIS
jgi:hypothetical protein